jgi:hypothetical protein
MAKAIVSRRKASTVKPAAKLAAVRIFADGSLSGTQLVRDLSLVGLELTTDNRGAIWLKRSPAGWANRLPIRERKRVMGGITAELADIMECGDVNPFPVVSRAIGERSTHE